MVREQLPLGSSVETVFHGEDEALALSSRRTVRVGLALASACALLAVVGLVGHYSNEESQSTELMWGGPLSFDMVHTHILNMKMRRSRLKEKLKQAALKRKDREIAQEHGFNSQGSMQQAPAPQQQMAMAPPAPQYAPPPPQFQEPPQAPQMYEQPPQYGAPSPQMMGAPSPQFGGPAPQFGAPAPPAPQFQAPYQQLPQQMPMYGQPPAPQYGAPGQQPGYPPAPQFAVPEEAPQLAQMPQQQANPWGGMTVNSAPSPAVPVEGPTESSSDDKDQQRAQAAASIQAYEQFMHGAAPAKQAGPGGAQGMMMHA